MVLPQHPLKVYCHLMLVGDIQLITDQSDTRKQLTLTYGRQLTSRQWHW